MYLNFNIAKYQISKKNDKWLQVFFYYVAIPY